MHGAGVWSRCAASCRSGVSRGRLCWAWSCAGVWGERRPVCSNATRRSIASARFMSLRAVALGLDHQDTILRNPLDPPACKGALAQGLGQAWAAAKVEAQLRCRCQGVDVLAAGTCRANEAELQLVLRQGDLSFVTSIPLVIGRAYSSRPLALGSFQGSLGVSSPWRLLGNSYSAAGKRLGDAADQGFVAGLRTGRAR